MSKMEKRSLAEVGRELAEARKDVETAYEDVELLRQEVARMSRELAEARAEYSRIHDSVSAGLLRECEQERDRLRGLVAPMEKALEWYSREEHYHCGKGDIDETEVERDEGRMARQALAGGEGE